MGVDVVYLIGIASCKYYHVVFQVVDVESLHRGHAVAPEELVVSAGDRRIGDDLLLMALWVVLIERHGLLSGRRLLLLLAAVLYNRCIHRTRYCTLV